MSFVIPIHAVDLELEKPDRFYVQDVWEVVDEPTEDVIAGLEGTERSAIWAPPTVGLNDGDPFTHHPRLSIGFGWCFEYIEVEEKLLESGTAWAAICTNAVFDKLYSVTK